MPTGYGGSDVSRGILRHFGRGPSAHFCALRPGNFSGILHPSARVFSGAFCGLLRSHVLHPSAPFCGLLFCAFLRLSARVRPGPVLRCSARSAPVSFLLFLLNYERGKYNDHFINCLSCLFCACRGMVCCHGGGFLQMSGT